MAEGIHVFIYAPDTAAGIPSEKVRDDSVQGTLFEVDGVGPALLLSGHARVHGEVCRVDPAAVATIDERARVADGMFRRVGVEIGDTPCWAWVAGPALAQRLAASRKLPGGKS